MAEPFIGEIKIFGGSFAPQGWAFCNGDLLPISQNTALFSLIGTTYGGDGRVSFALPDLRGRVAVGFGAGPGLSPHQLGERNGAENVTLNVNEMPAHKHEAVSNVTSGEATTNIPTATTCLAAGSAVNNRTSIGTANIYAETSMIENTAMVGIGSAGGNAAHNNMQPYLAVNYIIALVGIFPSRS